MPLLNKGFLKSVIKPKALVQYFESSGKQEQKVARPIRHDVRAMPEADVSINMTFGVLRGFKNSQIKDEWFLKILLILVKSKTI